MTCLGLGAKSNPNAGHVRVDLSDMATSETWTPVSGVYEIVLEWSADENSSECYITVANHPALDDLYPFNRIRLVNESVSPEQTFFIGRINKIDPKFKGALSMRGAQGYAFVIYARDYMQALADNFVAANIMHDTYAFKAAASATYVPIYDDDADELEPPGQARSSRYQIISDLVTRTGIIPDVTPSVTMPIGSISTTVARNYMDTPQLSVLGAIQALASEQPWDSASPPSGTGYIFRVAPPGLMGNGAVFQYFQRGQIEFDVTQDFGWVPDSTDDSLYPILTFRAIHEGQSIYSRSRVMGKGLSSYTAPSISIPDMEDTWNPSEGLYKVTREATSNDEILTQLIELQQRARTGLTAASDGTVEAFRGDKIGTITVMGIPLNANNVSPIPGDTIKLNPVPPGLENPGDSNKYVISHWKFTWPEGMSTYTLNRRAKARSVSLNQKLMQRGLSLLSSMKDIYDSGWLRFDVTGEGEDIVPMSRQFMHFKGVIPRHVFIYAADHGELTAVLSTDPNSVQSAIMIMPSQYDPIQNMFIGYQITAVTPKMIQINFYPFLGFSQGAINGGWRDPDTGWLKVNQSTSIRVFVSP